jgi:molecular chaperone GrpE (heat shock protein)
MATLTDEERAAQILGEQVEPKADEHSPEIGTRPEDEEETPEAEEPEEEESEEEKPTEDEEEPEKPADSTFTKQFPNLKGETLADYTPELEKAYDNSFKEALRLNQVIKDNAAKVAQAEAIIAQAQQPIQQNPEAPASPAPPVNTNLGDIDSHPAIQYAKAKQTEDMLSAFDDFKKNYPQATDQQAFDAFTKASDGVNSTLSTTLGRAPTYQELFPAIARLLGWEPTLATAKKNAAIKENTASGRTQGSQSPAAPKPSKVSDAEVEAYMKMFTSKTREEAIKDLSEVKV